MRLWVAAGLSLAVMCGSVWAMPHGTVRHQDGREWPDVEWEVDGDTVTLKLRFGEIQYPISELTLIPSAPESEADGPMPEDTDTAVARQARFQLVAPDGWELFRSTDPQVFLSMRHLSKDARLEVRLLPITTVWTADPDDRRIPPEHTEAVASELRRRYGMASQPRLIATRLQGAPVYRFENLQVREWASDRNAVRMIDEVRFQQFGFEYALTFTVARADRGAVVHQIDDAFKSFSFLPSMETTADRYMDYTHGFEITRPEGDDWTLASYPFEPARPLEIFTEEQRGLITATTITAEDNLRGVLRTHLEQRASELSRYSGERITEAELGGSQVLRFLYEGFIPGETRQLRFQGFAARTGPNVLVLTGRTPISSGDAAQLEATIQATLNEVWLYNPTGVSARVSTGQDAVGAVAAAAADLEGNRFQAALREADRAIGLHGRYALAFYVRGQAYKGLNDFRQFQEAVEQAAELNPDAGYDAEIMAGLSEQARQLDRDRNYTESVPLWLRIHRSTGDDRDLRSLVNAGRGLWSEWGRDEERIDRNMREFDRLFRRSRDISEVQAMLANAYRDAANKLMRAEEFRDAKRWAERLRDLDAETRYETDGERLLETIDNAEERARDR